MTKYVYVDNSNLWIEGMKVAAVQHEMCVDIGDASENKIFDRKWRYDFGKLLKLVGGEKNGLKKAFLFGSRPPQNDSLWRAAKECGFEEPIIEDRNAQNHEKKVDTGIAVKMIEDSFLALRQGDIMVLVAGDSDYVPAIKSIRNRGIQTIIAFWEHAAYELKAAADSFFSLNPHLESLCRDTGEGEE